MLHISEFQIERPHVQQDFVADLVRTNIYPPIGVEFGKFVLSVHLRYLKICFI